MAGLDATFHVEQTPRGIEVIIPSTMRNEVAAFVKRITAKSNGFMRVRMDAPARPINKGYRGQLSRHWAHMNDIALQLSTPDRGYSKEDIDIATRRMAAAEGLRTFLSIDGIEEPIHSSEWVIEDANLVEQVKQRFADEHGLYLTEYVDAKDPAKGTYRSMNGRTFEEMQKLKGGADV